MKNYYRDYRVIGSMESLIEFEFLLGLINFCKGSSRTISVNVDGCGSAHIGIKRLKDNVPEDFIEIDTKELQLFEEDVFRRFYGDEVKAKEAADQEIKTLESKIQDFKDGHGISIHIGE